MTPKIHPLFTRSDFSHPLFWSTSLELRRFDLKQFFHEEKDLPSFSLSTPSAIDLEKSFETLAFYYFQYTLSLNQRKTIPDLIEISKEQIAPLFKETPLSAFYFFVELPWLWASLTEKTSQQARLAKFARTNLVLGMKESMNAQGMIESRHWHHFPLIVASLTRSRMLAEEINQEGWSKKALSQYDWMIRHVFRSLRADGGFAGENLPSLDSPLLQARDWNEEHLLLLIEQSGEEDDLRIARNILPRMKPKLFDQKEGPLPSVEYQSEAARIAWLQTEWSQESSRLAILYPQAKTWIELSQGNDLFLRGEWSFTLEINGSLVQPAGDWENVCWAADEDALYLELQLPLSNGRRLQRQFLLARKDQFALLADACIGDSSEQWNYIAELPLPCTARWEEEKDSFEGRIFSGKREALLVPLALKEWRQEEKQGAFEVDLSSKEPDKKIRMSLTGDGNHFYVPLWIDLDPLRRSQPVTWRHLTVGQSLQVVDNNTAVGYRMARGDEQWLLYRSLAEKKNRTLLGHNLATEFLCARFQKGTVTAIMEVE